MVRDLGDHDLRVVSLADTGIDALHHERFPGLSDPGEVSADRVAARIEDLIADARARADAADPGDAFFGFLARIKLEAAAKRDLPDAIAIPGPSQDALHTALEALLRRAQQAGAVRADVGVPDIIVLFKAIIAGVRDSAADSAVHERIFAVIADGLRAGRSG